MKLTPLTAGIDARWEVVQECRIEAATDEGGRELRRVHAGDVRLMSRRDEFGREDAGVSSPQRKRRGLADARPQLFAIPSHVLEKQIAERKRLHDSQYRPRARERLAPCRLVVRI